MDIVKPSEEDIQEILSVVNVDKFLNSTGDNSVIEMDLYNKHYKIMNGVYINVFIDMLCDANCPFCINKAKEIVNPSFKRDVKNISLNEFIHKFDELYDNLYNNMSAKPIVNITGGEPTISPRFIPFIQHLLKRRIGFEIITNTTNLHKDYILQNMMYNCKSINISRNHYDDDKNKELMNLNVKVTNENLKKAVEFVTNNFQVNRIYSVGCVMMKNGIHTLEDIKKYIDTYSYINPSLFFVRQMENVSDYLHNKDDYDKIMWKYEWIENDLLNDNDFKLIGKRETEKHAIDITFMYKNKYTVIFSARPDQAPLESEISRKFTTRIILLPNGQVVI